MNSKAAAVEVLANEGARFILCDKDSRKPGGLWYEQKWGTHRVGIDRATEWVSGGNPIGLVPASIGAIVFDVDKGGMRTVQYLINELGFNPYANIPTRSRGHCHLLIGTEQAREVSNRDLYRGSVKVGELIANNKYIVLWHIEPYAESVSEWHSQCEAAYINTIAVQPQLAGMPPTPKEIIKAATNELPDNFSGRTKLNMDRVRVAALQAAGIGTRNDMLCRELGRVLRDKRNWRATEPEVLEAARVINNLFSHPLSFNQIESTARSLSRKEQAKAPDKVGEASDWEGYRQRQKRRQRLGVDKRRERHKLDLRDWDIHRLHRDGMSHRKLAKQFSLSVRAVQLVLAKPCPANPSYTQTIYKEK